MSRKNTQNKELKTKKKELETKKFDSNFTNKYHESDQYVALQNKNISDLWGWSKDNDFSNETLEILVKITNKENKQTIYRQAVGYAAKDFEEGHIMLSYRSLKKLGVPEKVIVQPTNWFCYLWHHALSQIRYPFRIAVAVAVLSFLLDIISLITQ